MYYTRVVVFLGRTSDASAQVLQMFPLEVFARATKLGDSVFQIVWQKRCPEEVQHGVPIVRARSLGAQLVPFLQAAIAPAEPGQGYEIDLFVLVHGTDKGGEFPDDRIVAAILEDLDHLVISRI